MTSSCVRGISLKARSSRASGLAFICLLAMLPAGHALADDYSTNANPPQANAASGVDPGCCVLTEAQRHNICVVERKCCVAGELQSGTNPPSCPPPSSITNCLAQSCPGPHPNNAGAKGIGRSNASVPTKGPATVPSAPAIDLLHAMDDCLREGLLSSKSGQRYTSGIYYYSTPVMIPTTGRTAYKNSTVLYDPNGGDRGYSWLWASTLAGTLADHLQALRDKDFILNETNLQLRCDHYKIVGYLARCVYDRQLLPPDANPRYAFDIFLFMEGYRDNEELSEGLQGCMTEGFNSGALPLYITMLNGPDSYPEIAKPRPKTGN